MRQEAWEIMELAKMVDGTPHVERFSSVQARPMPRYLLGKISDKPGTYISSVFYLEGHNVPAYVTDTVPMLAPRMTSPAINWFIVLLVQQIIPPVIVRH